MPIIIQCVVFISIALTIYSFSTIRLNRYQDEHRSMNIRGVLLLNHARLTRLKRWARVTICLESYCDAWGLDKTPFAELMVAPGYEVELIKDCQRVVIF